MDQLFPLLGNWTWWIAAGVLLFGELMLPGVFLIWLALAAAAVAVIDLIFDMVWQVELALFSGFAVVFVLVARSWMIKRPPSDRTHLNRRMFDYVGQSYPLDQPITGGRGRLRIDDTVWEALGPDLPQGAMVRVTAVEGLKLRVVPAN
jgi:membrane protein implicated in regulation of membrane protease activity